ATEPQIFGLSIHKISLRYPRRIDIFLHEPVAASVGVSQGTFAFLHTIGKEQQHVSRAELVLLLLELDGHVSAIEHSGSRRLKEAGLNQGLFIFSKDKNLVVSRVAVGNFASSFVEKRNIQSREFPGKLPLCDKVVYVVDKLSKRLRVLPFLHGPGDAQALNLLLFPVVEEVQEKRRNLDHDECRRNALPGHVAF